MKTTLIAAASSFVVLLVALTAISTTQSVVADEAQKPAYVGASKCMRCHIKQFKSWQESPFASTLEDLKPGKAVAARVAAGLERETDYSKDPKCLKCHTTGYGTETGYPAPRTEPAWTAAETARAARTGGVICEACHGPASLFIPVKKANRRFKRAEIVAVGATMPATSSTCAPCHGGDCPTMGEEHAYDFEALLKKLREGETAHVHVPLRYEH